MLAMRNRRSCARSWAAIVSLSLCLLASSATAGNDALVQAEREIARGRYTEALRTLSPLVKRNKPRALALAGRVHALRGERGESERLHRQLIALYNRGALDESDGRALWAVAEATRALGAVRDAHETFARAVAAAPDDPEIELAWAELLMEKHALDQAAASVRSVLEKQPHHPRALERLARIELEQGRDFAAVEARLDAALAGDPELGAAYVTRAGLALRDEDPARAEAELSRALAINPRDLEALSVRAAVHFVRDDEPSFQRELARIHRENPRFSRAYSIVASYAEWEHRYAELVQLSEAAIRIDPEDAFAHATRGINLLRVGREQEGLDALKRAWALDRYNEEVFNLLELYERVIERDYERFEVAPFSLRMARRERAVLEPYALPLLLRAQRELSQHYGFSPSVPTHVELYASQEHFSIRATGLPQLGVQGICFGNVLIALSPRAGEFSWAQILWHELSHVFHVQLSRGRVPRWFTEGLAEYETERAHATWKREDDRALYDAVVREQLPQLAALNRAFTHARTPAELMVAYHASAQAAGYLVRRYGDEAIAAMLRAWGEGLSSEQVFTRVLGATMAEVDRDFRGELMQRLDARYRHDLRFDLAAYQELARHRQLSAAPGAGPDQHAGLALALAEAGEYDAARSRAEALLVEHPAHALARFTLVHVALKKNDLRTGQRELEALLAHGHDGYQLRMLQARMALAKAEPRAALAPLAWCMAHDPTRVEAFTLMSEVAAQLGEQEQREQALRGWATLDQHARAPVLSLLALLERRGAHEELVRWAREGLYRDVHEPALHLALARGLSALGQRQEAREEARRALESSQGEARRRALELLREIERSLRPRPARMGTGAGKPR